MSLSIRTRRLLEELAAKGELVWLNEFAMHAGRRRMCLEAKRARVVILSATVVRLATRTVLCAATRFARSDGSAIVSGGEDTL
jgi:hypothetical protein